MTVTSFTNIKTGFDSTTGHYTGNGDQSNGIVAQSIGGGGGSGGFSIAGSASFGGGAAGSIGGHGGTGGNAGTVTVTNTGSIFTAGEQANGIEAQSIGGGGGNGGYSVAGR